MGLLDILKQYAAPGATPSGDVAGHFDSVAQQADPKAMGGGIAAAMRSDATPPFEQIIAHLFSQSDPQQKAGVLNELTQVLGSAGIAGAGGGVLSRILGASGAGASAPITSSQAAQVSPEHISAIAASAQQQDDSIVDRLGAFYAQHPTLVKTLGVAALSTVMSHVSQQQRTW